MPCPPYTACLLRRYKRPFSLVDTERVFALRRRRDPLEPEGGTSSEIECCEREALGRLSKTIILLAFLKLSDENEEVTSETVAGVLRRDGPEESSVAAKVRSGPVVLDEKLLFEGWLRDDKEREAPEICESKLECCVAVTKKFPASTL